MSLRSRPTRAKGVLRARSGRVCGATGTLLRAGAPQGKIEANNISQTTTTDSMAQCEDSSSCRRQPTTMAVRSGDRQIAPDRQTSVTRDMDAACA